MSHHGGSGFHRLLLMLVIVASARNVHGQALSEVKCQERANKCCSITMFSTEFYECCKKMRCCPATCRVAVESTINSHSYFTTTNITDNSIPPISHVTALTLKPGQRCESGRVCCRFRPNTMEFVQCCEKYRCFPSCDQAPKGCCYNGRVWVWGSVVEMVEEACVNLKCAAEKIDHPPFLSARLVLVDRPGAGCTELNCLDCKQLRCVDETGLVREEGEKFNIGRCRKCECLAGGKVECRRVLVKCPPLPNPTPRHCRMVKGPCCPSLNCSVERTCRDHNNQVRALYSTWKSDPCTKHKCTLAGIITKRKPCPSKPHPNCMKEDELQGGSEKGKPVGKKDRCCPKWRCGPDCRLVRCSLVPPGEDCKEVYEPLACCPKWNCSGCVDSENQYHPMGGEWHPTPCTSLTCTPLGIVNTTARCKPKPHEVCMEDPTQEGCCPVYDCGGCIDKNTFRPMFSTWEAGPCIFFNCTPRGIVPVEKKCPPKPHENCYEGPLGDDCCPKWECGIDCRLVDCAGPPQVGCTPYLPPLSCCTQWNCSVCVDEKGRRRAVGSTWRTDDPCTNQTCTATGQVVSVSSSCGIPDPPRKGCFRYTPEGECCPRWNCSGCLDDDGNYHPMFQAWTSDPCTRHFCDPAGIFTQVMPCPTLRPMPHPNCVEQVPPGECCRDWKCGPDCRLIFCPLPPEGDCTPYRPPLACCDQYTCSGCTDDTGRKRSIGNTWFTPPCFLHTCKKEGVVTYNLCEGNYPSYQSKRRRSIKVKEEPASTATATSTTALAPALAPPPLLETVMTPTAPSPLPHSRWHRGGLGKLPSSETFPPYN